MEDTPTMLFSKMQFRDGINMTVRRGTKWCGTRGTVRAQATEGDEAQDITVLDTVVTTFKELEEGGVVHAFLEFEHDPDCRYNVYNLFQVMKACYPPDTPTSQGGFIWAEVVTLVLFTTEPLCKCDREVQTDEQGNVEPLDVNLGKPEPRKGRKKDRAQEAPTDG